MEKQQRTGSACVLTAVEPGIIDRTYTDYWSAFDRGRSTQLIPGIGKSRCDCAVKTFQILAAKGLPSHFIERVNELTIRTYEYEVSGKPLLSGKSHGRFIPLEWLYRMRAYGSLLDRLKDGVVRPADLGYPPGTEVTEGMKLPRMLVECTTKLEQVDRHLSTKESEELAGLGVPQRQAARELVVKGARVIGDAYEKAGFIIPDGKCELGIRNDGTIVFVDVLGTQDENRILEAGTHEMYSKDLIRHELERLGYKKALDEAKLLHPLDKTKWPPYPELSKKFLIMVAARYEYVDHRYQQVHID